jgi:predicted secreted Zn-dependent protease
MKKRLKLTAFACVLGIMTGVYSAVTPSSRMVAKIERTDYYEVSGKTLPEIKDNMKTSRPKDYDAWTDWYVNWNYEFYMAKDRCTLRSFDVSLAIRYTYPFLIDADKKSKKIKERWEEYIENLQTHETGHTAIALDAAYAMLSKIQVDTMQDENREKLKAKIDKICNEIIEQHLKKEIEYDKKTDHGRTQGARL